MRINHILDQVDKAIIVDNHSDERSVEMLRLMSTDNNIHLILNGENLGVATALNQGVRYASSCGYTWALTLDQDTVPHPTMVQNLISAYNDCPFKEEVGIIGSNYPDRNTGRDALYDGRYGNRSWFEMKEVITSGSLISIPIFKKIGPFRDDFFIDAVDQEYCLRLRVNGFKVISGRKSGMIHSIGNCEFKKFLWRNLAKLNHPPLRSYYIVRNNLLLVREYFWKEPGWALKSLYGLGKRFVSTIIFEDNKILKIRYICLGICHALLSKGGKVHE